MRHSVGKQGYDADGEWAATAGAMIWAERGPQDSLRLFSDRIARVTAVNGRVVAAPTRLRARAEDLIPRDLLPERQGVDRPTAVDAADGPEGAPVTLEDAAARPTEQRTRFAKPSAPFSSAAAARRIVDEPDCFDEIYAELDYETAPSAEVERGWSGKVGARWSQGAPRRTPLGDVIFLTGLAAVFVMGLVGALAPLVSGGAAGGGGAGPTASEQIETNSILAAATAADQTLCEQRMVETATPLDSTPPPDMAMSRVGGLKPIPCAGTPVSARERISQARAAQTEEIATASLSPYLGAKALHDLIAARPEKCVIDPVAGVDACAELVRYDTEAPRFIRTSPLVKGALLEVNGGYGIEGDALCHYGSGVSAMVIGGALDRAEAKDFERQVEAHYQGAPGEKICQRLRRAGAEQGREFYVADVFIDGARADERSDPRLFELRIGS